MASFPQDSASDTCCLKTYTCCFEFHETARQRARTRTATEHLPRFDASRAVSDASVAQRVVAPRKRTGRDNRARVSSRSTHWHDSRVSPAELLASGSRLRLGGRGSCQAIPMDPAVRFMPARFEFLISRFVNRGF